MLKHTLAQAHAHAHYFLFVYIARFEINCKFAVSFAACSARSASSSSSSVRIELKSKCDVDRESLPKRDASCRASDESVSARRARQHELHASRNRVVCSEEQQHEERASPVRFSCGCCCREKERESARANAYRRSCLLLLLSSGWALHVLLARNDRQRERGRAQRWESAFIRGVEKAGKMNAIMCFVYVLNERNEWAERERERKRWMNCNGNWSDKAVSSIISILNARNYAESNFVIDYKLIFRLIFDII